MALNWEGHDDWLSNTAPVQTFADGLPEPLPKPLPLCAELARKHAANNYEQVPIENVNCVAKRK